MSISAEWWMWNFVVGFFFVVRICKTVQHLYRQTKTKKPTSQNIPCSNDMTVCLLYVDWILFYSHANFLFLVGRILFFLFLKSQLKFIDFMTEKANRLYQAVWLVRPCIEPLDSPVVSFVLPPVKRIPLQIFVNSWSMRN